MSNFFKKKPATAVIDPIEAAKIAAPPPPEASAPPPPAPTPDPVAAVAPPPPSPSAHKTAKVKVGKNVSLHGQFTFLPAGAIISEGSYGPGIFEKLAEAGVELEPLG